MERDPEFRLGCEESRDGQDIQNHPFFASIDWNKYYLFFITFEKKKKKKLLFNLIFFKKSRLLRGELPPPYIPKIETVADVSYFDPSFTNEPVYFCSSFLYFYLFTFFKIISCFNVQVILTPVTNGSVFEQNFDGFSFVGENAFHMN